MEFHGVPVDHQLRIWAYVPPRLTRKYQKHSPTVNWKFVKMWDTCVVLLDTRATHCLMKWGGSSQWGTDAGPRACRQVFSKVRQAFRLYLVTCDILIFCECCHSSLPPIQSSMDAPPEVSNKSLWCNRTNRTRYNYPVSRIHVYWPRLPAVNRPAGHPLDQQSLDRGEEQHCIHQLLEAVAWLRALLMVLIRKGVAQVGGMMLGFLVFSRGVLICFFIYSSPYAVICAKISSTDVVTEGFPWT